MGGGPRDDHRLDLHPPTNRFLTDRTCYSFRHSCSPDGASTQHRLRAHGPKPVNVASLSTSCSHASHEQIGSERRPMRGGAIKVKVYIPQHHEIVSGTSLALARDEERERVVRHHRAPSVSAHCERAEEERQLRDKSRHVTVANRTVLLGLGQKRRPSQ
jgi:hypothetical protein